jgi:3-hydroxyacyl-[acyl-carrier-protein] dehydratase
MISKSLTIDQIEKILPQRYPFLLIDKVLDYKENDYLVAVKNITGNEWACGERGEAGEFPQVLLVEAAAQAAIVLYHVSKIKSEKRPQYFLGKVEAEFLYPFQIGDQLKIKVSSGRMLEMGGYSDISIDSQDKKNCMIRIFYGIKN